MVDVNAPGFSRLCDDVFERPHLAVVRPLLRVLPGGRTGPVRRDRTRQRGHLRVVAAARR